MKEDPVDLQVTLFSFPLAEPGSVDSGRICISARMLDGVLGNYDAHRVRPNGWVGIYLV